MHTEELRQLYLQCNKLEQQIRTLEVEDLKERAKENQYLVGQCFISEDTSYHPCYYQVIRILTDDPRYAECLYFHEPLLAICKNGTPIGYFGIKEELIDSLKTRTIPITQEVFKTAARDTLEQMLKEYEKYEDD